MQNSFFIDYQSTIQNYLLLVCQQNKVLVVANANAVMPTSPHVVHEIDQQEFSEIM
jgi:hypothetical protein